LAGGEVTSCEFKIKKVISYLKTHPPPLEAKYKMEMEEEDAEEGTGP